MLTRLIAAVVLLLALAGQAGAQTQTLFAWDFDNVTPAEVATYTQAASIDGAAVTNAITCAAKPGAPGSTSCSVPIAPLAPGAHTLSVLVARNGQTAETRIAGLNPTNGPRSASAPRVVVTVTITVP